MSWGIVQERKAVFYRSAIQTSHTNAPLPSPLISPIQTTPSLKICLLMTCSNLMRRFTSAKKSRRVERCYIDFFFMSLHYWRHCSDVRMSSNLSGFSPRFYCVDFDIQNLVISIKDPMPVSREKKKWGHRRIAVEGEIIQQVVIITNCGHVLYISRHHRLLSQGNILVVLVWTLAGDILLCSWARHFTHTVSLLKYHLE